MVKATRGQPRVVRALVGTLALLLAGGALSLGWATPVEAQPTAAQSALTHSIAQTTPPTAMLPTVDTPTPSPSANVAAESIGIWVRLGRDTSNVPNVQAKIAGPKGFSETVTTGADGRATVNVPPGTYTVDLVASSLPAGLSVPDVQKGRSVQVATGNTGIPAYFLLVNATTGTGNVPGHNSGTAEKTSLAALILPRVASGLIFGLLLALAAIGVSLIYGTTGLNNFSHGEMVTFGGLMGYLFSGIIGLPGWIGILASIVLGGAFGYLQDLGLWKPLRKRGVQIVPLMIVSIGLSLALRYLYSFIFGPGQLVLPADNSAAVSWGPVNLRSTDIFSAVISIVLLLLVAFLLLRTRIGRATRAVADNRSLAAASGIDVERVIRIVWVGAGALAGLSGVLLGYYQTLRWDSGASILLLIFAAVTLGGLGTAFGALIGSIIIGLFVDLSTLILPANLKYVSALVVMIIILLFRPQGILGRRDRIG